MPGRIRLALITALAVASMAVPFRAQAQWGPPAAAPRFANGAYEAGYERGVRAGDEDSRRRQSFNFTDESDYRRADAGYRSQSGSPDRYRQEFRRGFEAGYRAGYGRNPGYAGSYGPGLRQDFAAEQGYRDGYDEGLNDGRRNHRFDPIAESRYRSGDHGYSGRYGSREAYRFRYRDAFRQGYERGYADGRRGGRGPWGWLN